MKKFKLDTILAVILRRPQLSVYEDGHDVLVSFLTGNTDSDSTKAIECLEEQLPWTKGLSSDQKISIALDKHDQMIKAIMTGVTEQIKNEIIIVMKLGSCRIIAEYLNVDYTQSIKSIAEMARNARRVRQEPNRQEK